MIRVSVVGLRLDALLGYKSISNLISIRLNNSLSLLYPKVQIDLFGSPILSPSSTAGAYDTSFPIIGSMLFWTILGLIRFRIVVLSVYVLCILQF